MPNFKTREETEAWLKTRRQDEAALIASRAAMRALPVFATRERKDMLDVLLAVFRALSASQFVSIWPDSGKEFTHDDLRKRNEFIYDIVTRRRTDVILNDSASNSAAIAAVGAVEAAEFAFWNPTGHHSAGNAGHTIYASAFRAIHHADGADTNLGIVDASEADAVALEKGTTVSELSAMPLWPDGKTPEALISLWDNLKSQLPDGENWDVWTDWYEARLLGTPVNKDVEQAWNMFSYEYWNTDPYGFWTTGPGPYNAAMKRVIEHLGKSESQSNPYQPTEKAPSQRRRPVSSPERRGPHFYQPVSAAIGTLTLEFEGNLDDDRVEGEVSRFNLLLRHQLLDISTNEGSLRALGNSWLLDYIGIERINLKEGSVLEILEFTITCVGVPLGMIAAYKPFKESFLELQRDIRAALGKSQKKFNRGMIDDPPLRFSRYKVTFREEREITIELNDEEIQQLRRSSG